MAPPSAGVGRTGTLIAIQCMMQMLEDESQIDVFNFVLGMRHQRNYMVQTEVGGCGTFVPSSSKYLFFMLPLCLFQVSLLPWFSRAQSFPCPHFMFPILVISNLHSCSTCLFCSYSYRGSMFLSTTHYWSTSERERQRWMPGTSSTTSSP